jgi:DNA-binding beta-propeller fold protein YncE
MTTLSRFIKPLLLAGFAAVVAVGVAHPALAQETSAPAAAQAPQSGPRLDFPAGLVTDSRSVWVANSRNNTIVAIDIASRSATVLAGELFKDGSNDGVGPTARFHSPDGMAMIGRNIYVADTTNSDIRKINLDTKTVSTAAGVANISGTDDGPAGQAHFNLPTQLATDGSNLYITDSGNSTIRRLNLSDNNVKTIGGQAQQTGKDDGPPAKSTFNGPRGIATDGKFIYIADTGNDIIRKIDISSLETKTIAGTGEEGVNNGPGDKATFSNPGAMCINGSSLYVLDADNHAIRKIDTNTNEVSTLTLVNGHIGSGCAVTADGHTLYYSDTTENSVQSTDTSNGNFTPLFPPQ